MAAGATHVLLIRPKSGQLLSWGAVANGVLGHSCMARHSSPKAVEFFANMNKGLLRVTVISVACGKAHSMALTDCGLYSWGSSKHGQLGLGRKVLMTKHPTLVSRLAKIALVGIACGQYHSAAWSDKGNKHTMLQIFSKYEVNTKNLKKFLPLRFYVKSFYGISEVSKPAI